MTVHKSFVLNKIFTCALICILINIHGVQKCNAQYCIPYFNNAGIYINNFQFNTLLNTHSGTEDSGYIFYPATTYSTTVSIGHNYPLSVSQDGPGGAIGKFAAWIDYNNDSVFSKSELVCYDSTRHGSATVSVAIPNDVSIIGKKRMRVMYVFYPPTVIPCSVNETGEAEDYEIYIDSSYIDTLVYCMPFYFQAYQNKQLTRIDNFSLNTLTNDSAISDTNGYHFYPINTFTTTLYMDSAYPVVFNKFAGGVQGYSIWADLNNDGVFSDSERLFYSNQSIGNVIVPYNISYEGIHRLRTSTTWDHAPTTACGLFTYGETQDYEITIKTKDIIPAPPLHSANNNVTIFPNPTKNSLNISANEIVNISLFSIDGRCVFIKDDAKQIDITALADGIYIAKLYDDKNKIIEIVKIVKE